MKIKTVRTSSKFLRSVKIFRFVSILSIFSISMYIVWQKNLSLQERYVIAHIENQNRKIGKMADIITVRFYKNSSILKLQNYALNDGLTYYKAKVEERKSLKPVLVALFGKPSNAVEKQ